VIEGKRWLDDAFACGGQAQEATRALALMARGFLYFLAGSPANSDADLEAALAIFRDRNDVPAIALTSSFYAELAFARGDTVEARRRRVDVLAFYVGLPDEPFVLAARAYSRAILAILDGDLVEAEHHYREAAGGFSRRDRPVLRTICLGMLADFDERAFNYASAIEELEEAVELSDALQLKGFSGALLSRLAWVLLLDGNVERAEIMTERSLDLGRRLRNAPVVFVALTSSALVHRHHGRNGDAAAAASEALELYQAGGPRRFGNRIDPEFDLLAGASACCAVLAVLAADEGKGDQAAQLLGCAERLSVAAGAPMLELLQGDIERARDAAMALLGHDAFVAAFEQGRRGELGKLVGVSASG
jgi:tetratricopeptide (TPR) repeat protein